MTKKYPPDSVGGKMISNIPICGATSSIADVSKMLFEDIDNLETINYIYVTDSKGKLVGVFSIKDVFRKPAKLLVKNIMVKDFIKIRAFVDQEKVVILALRNNLKSIPVVDKEDKLIGIVPSDVILDILHVENVEHFLVMAGIHSPLQKIIKGSPLYLFKARIPWLILGLFGGVLGAIIIRFFEGSLQAHFILASFIPLMLYMAGAVGSQTETLLIRNIALESGPSFGTYLFRELKTAFLIAVILSALLFPIAFFLFKSPYFIGMILSISLFVAIFAAVIVGVAMPYILTKMKKDPAIGSSPFATIIRDILSLIIYFSVSSILLSFFNV